MLLSCCSSRVYKTPFICHINLSQDVKIDNRICRFVHAHAVSLTVCCLHQSGGEGNADGGIGVIVNSLGMFPLKSTHTSSLEPNALLLLLLLVSLQTLELSAFLYSLRTLTAVAELLSLELFCLHPRMCSICF